MSKYLLVFSVFLWSNLTWWLGIWLGRKWANHNHTLKEDKDKP